MRESQNITPPPPANAESLTAAMCTLVRSHGGHAGYHDMNMALGLPFTFCTDKTELDVSRFATLGRDVALIDAAALFGVALRPLHPRATANSLFPSPEFGLHFQDSYVPLIRRALAHDQPVLAWQGWAAPVQDSWGIITKAEGENDALSGIVFGCSNVVPLVAAAFQCYVAEEIQPRTPAAAEALICATTGVSRLHEDCAGGSSRECGEAAWRIWADRVPRIADEQDLEPHLLLTDNLRANRSWGLTWIDLHRSTFARYRGELRDLECSLREADDLLQSLRTSLADRQVDRAAGLLAEAADADRRGVNALRRLAEVLTPK